MIANKLLNKKVLKYLFLVAIIFRFIYLNYMNWKYGYFTTGIPGIQYWLDSDRYLVGAENILNNTPIIGRVNQYLGYLIFIALIKSIGLCLEFVLIFQLFFSIIAAFALFNLTKAITGQSISGYIAIALYLLNPFIVTWHTFILTESLYSSFVILSCWSIYKAINIRSLNYFILCLLIISSTIFIRPNGWIFIPICICLLIYYSKFLISIKISIIISVFFLIIIGAICIPSLNNAINLTTPIHLMKKGEVVYDHPEFRLEMPKDEIKNEENWSQGYSYIIKHPFSCIKLAFYRAGTMFIQIRPHHSTIYKIHILLWIIPAYFLAFFGFIKYRLSIIVYIILAVVIGHAFIIALTYASHESRFIIYILPIIYLLSGCGFSFALQKVKPFLNQTKTITKANKT